MSRKVSQTRIFGGKRYAFGGQYPTKATADTHIKKLREQGRSARCIRHIEPYFKVPVYLIYWRKGATR